MRLSHFFIVNFFAPVDSLSFFIRKIQSAVSFFFEGLDPNPQFPKKVGTGPSLSNVDPLNFFLYENQ